ncbi:hypothetical protein [uncultured Paraglaciecola sp.]|uniref:hypothetical protein n=1 Tax=uncultured Paraglaciecola sp. TaxID=1765024 RepID=UPI00260FB17A|nr:hypothetical protein [uncultured Paraglaciecola sp.]
MNNNTLDELATLTICQLVIVELLGEVPEGMCSTKKLAVLLDYLQSQQQNTLDQLLQQQH